MHYFSVYYLPHYNNIGTPLILIIQKTVKENLFSKHDNRHAFQSSGCYFGQGLGKRLQKDDSKNQHRSENHTTWSSPPNYVSNYNDGYCSRTGYEHTQHRRCSSVNCTPLSTLHMCKHSTIRADNELLSKFETVTKSSFRRFPRSHSLPDKMVNVRPSECTKWWYRPQIGTGTADHSKGAGTKDTSTEECNKNTQTYTTPLSVLAATQQPFQRHNPWTYSYKK